MTHRGTNFTAGPVGIEPGDTLFDCNCAQPVPGTPFCADIPSLTYIECNLINCVVAPDADIQGGSHYAEIPPEVTPDGDD